MSKAKSLLNYIPNATGGATILLYGDVGQWGEIDSQRVVTELIALEGQYASIDVRINSTGGDVFTGIAIFNALRASQANIKIYIDGLAASIAGVIALCGKPLYMSQYARLMLHKVSGGAYGSAKELRETAELIENLEASLSEMIAGRVRLTPEEVHERYFKDGQDHWLTAREALSLGMIDGIHDLPEEPTLSPSSSTEEIYNVFNNRLLQGEAQNQPNNDMALLDDIKAIPQFSGATEASVLDVLRQTAQKMQEQEETIASLTARLQEAEAREVDTLLLSALSDGRITEAQQPHYKTLLMADRASATALLESLPRAQSQRQGASLSTPSAKAFTSPGASASSPFLGKSWAELDQAGLLAQFKAQDPQAFAEAYKAEFGSDYQF